MWLEMNSWNCGDLEVSHVVVANFIFTFIIPHLGLI